MSAFLSANGLSSFRPNARSLFVYHCASMPVELILGGFLRFRQAMKVASMMTEFPL